MEDPLQTVIRRLEEIRDSCYVCDRVPIEDMISDLRRWAHQLKPEQAAQEIPTVRERPAAAKQQQLKARTG